MLTFRMDETNFAEGDRAGLRIVTGAGLKVDFNEFAADGQTLGLWHLHDGACQGEGAGLEDQSGGGHDFSNNGAASVEDGYRFVRDDGDYMDATFAGQPARSQVTLECWAAECARIPASDWSYHEIANFGKDADNWLAIRAIRRTDPSESRITTLLRVAGVTVGAASWVGTGADDLLESDQPFHVAAVLDSPSTLKLFVGGEQKAQDTTGILDLPAGDYVLRLGRYITGWAGYDLTGVLDEVRLSSAARYSAAFAPARLLASGTFTSSTFDAVRLAADWTDLVRSETIPTGCHTTWDVRAADETDVSGDPQATWQPYSGDPETLPDGRYFQWRAMLGACGDRLLSPAIESVDAVASEAGYNLYHATGPGPECIDYDQPWAQVGPSVTDAQTGVLAIESVHWFGIRPVDADGRESPTAQGEVRLEINAQADQEPDRPAGALAAAAVPLALGAARLQWRYRVGLGGVLPQTFRIFGDGGTGTIDYETPLDEVPWCEGRVWYTWTSDPLAPSAEHQLAVRAVTAAGVWDEQPAVAHVTPDAVPPGQVDALKAEVIP